MKKYIVISLAITGLGKKIHRSKDEVTEKDFPEGVAVKLVESGHLKEVKGKSSGKAKASDEASDEGADEASDEGADEASDEGADEGEGTDKSADESADKVANKEAAKGKKPDSKSK